MHSHQDWEPVVFRKRQTPESLRSKAAVTQAQRAGGKVDTVEKDKQREERDRFRKLEADIQDPTQEPPKMADLPCLSKPMQQMMIQGRVSKKMNQQALAHAINERVQVIQELETGKVVQNPSVLQKVNRALGTSLRFGVSGR